MSRKTLNQLSEEELLGLVENDSSIEVYDYPHEILEFISIYKIEVGEDRIPSKLLYKVYKRFSKSRISSKSFSDIMTDIFPSVRYGKGIMLLINKNAFILKLELLKERKKLNKFKYKSWQKHFNLFLNHYNLKSGLLPIKVTVLYKLYEVFCATVKRRPIALKQFVNFLKIHFEFKFNKRSHWFYVDRSIEQYLTKEMIEEMKKHGPKKENP